MPRAAHWLARLPEVRALAAALDSPLLDRGMIEELFGVSRRQAVRLMNGITPPRPGRATLLPREQLLAWLDALAAARPVRGELARRRHLQAELRAGLAAGRREAGGSRPIAAPPPPDDAGWPGGITLDAPGVLRIRFDSPEELLGRVLALAEDAAGDYTRFAARFGAPKNPAEAGKGGRP
jgi:hypothetical protein